jgi:hypothetical protein
MAREANESQNYHLQLPPPYNNIIVGGARSLLVHNPQRCYPNDNEEKQIDGASEFFRSWPESDVVGWPGPAELALDANEGGCWTGGRSFLTYFRNKSMY